MSTTQELLASRSQDPVLILAGQVLNVPTNLQFRDGTPAQPWFVSFETLCPFLQVLQTNANGTFDVWNPTQSDVTFHWKAHHMHSEEKEPLNPVSTIPTVSTVPAPQQICQLPSSLTEEYYLLGNHGLNQLETAEQARERAATTVIVSADPDAIQDAIDAASADDVIEVQTNNVYNPITIPAATPLVIRAGNGFNPVLSGQEAVKLTNGATNFILAGFTFNNCSPGNPNYQGAAVTFLTQGCIVDTIIFDRCTFNEVTSGSAVLLSFHWSTGGDLYYNPPQPSELSDNISFIECESHQACKDGNEGAAIALRAFRKAFFYKCDLDGENYQEGNGCRGLQLQNCPEAIVFETQSYNHRGNGEAIKFDVIGAPVAVRCSGHIIRSAGFGSVEGIDIDDSSDVIAIDCLAYGNDDEGISVDDSATCGLLNNKTWNNTTGILLEAGAVTELYNNHSYSNGTNYSILNGYALPPSNIDGLEVIPELDPAKKRQGALPEYLIPPYEGAVQGSVLYRDTSQWKKLAPGNQGEFLQTQGANANPQWAVAGGGGGKELAPVVVIGSANSAPTADTISDCDFLHDNTNLPASDAFAQAIAFLNGFGGGTIYVRRGYYQLPNNAAPASYILNNIQIIGEGNTLNGTVISKTNNSHGATPFFQLSGSGSGLQNLYMIIPNTTPFPYATGAIWISGDESYIENVTVIPGVDADYQWGATYITGVNTRLEKLSVVGFGATKLWSSCIALDNADGVAIIDCQLLNDYGSVGCIDIGGNSTYTGSKNVQIKDSLLLQNDSGGLAIDGTSTGVYSMEDLQIIGNVIQGGIRLTPLNADGLINSMIEQNRISTTTSRDGIELYNQGISYCSFSRNIINASGEGIVLEGQTGPCAENEICGNRINTSANGIRARTQKQLKISQNIVVSSGLNATGIYVYETPEDINIEGNIVRMLNTGGNAQGGGIRVEDDAKDIVCSKNNVYTIQNNPAAGIRFANGVTYGSINGNKVTAIGTGGSVYGIFVQNNCNKVTCTGNTLQMSAANGGTGIFIDGGGAAVNGTCVGNSINSGGLITPTNLGAGIQAANNDTA